MMQKNNEWLNSILACPGCGKRKIKSCSRKTPLSSYYECGHCNRIFPVDQFGVIDFQVTDKLVSLQEPYWGMWALAQNNSLEEYKKRSPGSVASPERDAVKPFSNFMDIDGLDVLDVGAGTDYVPAYILDHSVKHYVALDPLPVEQEIPFTKVQAWAELMPFRNETFDAAILGTSLDHILCLESFWNELHRVLKRGGSVYIWGDFFTDETFYKNVPQQRLFRKDYEEIIPKDEAFARHTADFELLRARFDDLKALQEKYGGYLVDVHHFRHIPINYLKTIKSYGFELEGIEVLGLTGHMDYFHFMKAFVRLRKGKARLFESNEITKQHVDILALLAGSTEKTHALCQQLTSLEYETGRAVNELGTVRRELALGRQEIDIVRQQVNIIRQDLWSGRQEIDAVRQEVNAISQNLSSGRQEVDVVRQEVNGIRQDLSSGRQEIDVVRKEVNAIRQDLYSGRQEVDVVRQEVNGIRQDLSSGRQEIDAVRQAVNSISQELASDRHEIDAIKDLLSSICREVGTACRDLSSVRQEIDALRQEMPGIIKGEADMGTAK
jgi:uncharacterized coiled-coil DUF342 family protein